MQFNLRHLQSALEIERLGSMSEAANRVHLTQSALTQGINKLENELNILLFERTTTGMLCTPAGALFLRRTTRAFSHLHDFSTVLFSADNVKKQSFMRSVTSRQLTALISLCEAQSYTAAAVRLGLTQPTVHRAIKDLETLCGLQLFTRSPTGVEPSWRARQLGRYASLFFAEFNQAIEEIGESHGRMNGSIKIGSLPLALSNIVPQCALQVLSTYPDAQISIVDGPYEEQLHALLHGQIDMIVGALRFPSPHSDIKQHALFDDALSIVVKADHPIAHYSALNDAQLQQLKWVVPGKGVPARQVFDDMFSKRNLPPPNTLIECSALAAIRGILINSERAALLPARQIEADVDAGLLAVCPIQVSETNRKIGITTRTNWQATRVQEHFLAILEQLFSQH